MTDLEPLQPEYAVELYLEEKKVEQSKATQYSHSSRLSHFVRWCDEKSIDNLNDLTGRKLHEYRLWRRNEGDLVKVTLKTQMDTLRVFVRWCESIDAVTPDLSTKVQSPTISADENVRNVMLTTGEAEKALMYLQKYDYASIEHVTLHLLWHALLRRGAARALDVDDYHADEQYLDVRHRPETGTPIKNQEEGERLISLNAETCQLLDDWIADQRPDVTDEFGREPLLATQYGRAHGQTIQKYIYAVTRPCFVTGECPHEKELQNCEAALTMSDASKCPTSISPHAIRRGAITHWLKRDVPTQVVSDRANVSPDVLDKHYDRRSEKEKMEQRRKFLGMV